MKEHRGELIPTRASRIERLKHKSGQTTLYDACWQEFHDIYRNLIHGLARKEGLNDADAQDPVQDVMAMVAKEMPRFKYDPAKGSFKAWLLRITRNKSIDYLRKRGREVELPRFSSETTPSTDPISRIPDSRI